jgi:hypothetical protein
MARKNVCDRCGASANARQMRETTGCDMPVAAAIDLVDQRVAFFGVSFSVLMITRSTSASVIFREGRRAWARRTSPARESDAARSGPCPP